MCPGVVVDSEARLRRLTLVRPGAGGCTVAVVVDVLLPGVVSGCSPVMVAVLARLPVADAATVPAIRIWAEAPLARVPSAQVTVVAVTVHGAVYEDGGFAAAFARLSDRIANFRTEPFRIYGPAAGGAHAEDTGWIVSFTRR